MYPSKMKIARDVRNRCSMRPRLLYKSSAMPSPKCRRYPFKTPKLPDTSTLVRSEGNCYEKEAIPKNRLGIFRFSYFSLSTGHRRLCFCIPLASPAGVLFPFRGHRQLLWYGRAGIHARYLLFLLGDLGPPPAILSMEPAGGLGLGFALCSLSGVGTSPAHCRPLPVCRPFPALPPAPRAGGHDPPLSRDIPGVLWRVAV